MITCMAAPTQDLRPARFYQPELDVLRFFAFFGVFCFHAFPHFRGFYDRVGVPSSITSALIPAVISGAYGVDLFFALSAFLITGLLLRERQSSGHVHLRSFYLRRILRIQPLYLGFIFLAALLSLMGLTEKIAPHYLAGYLLLAGNWMYVIYGLPAGFTIPLWTVSIEEQFYLTWPLVVRRASARQMAWAAVLILVAANALRIRLAVSGASLQAMEYNTFTRLDPIALGVLVALLTAKLPRWTSTQRAALLLGGIVSWIAASAFNGWHDAENPEVWRMAVTHPLIALGSTAILVSFMGWELRLLRNRALIYLGKISYGLYVLHEFGRFVSSRFIHPSTMAGLLAQMALSFTVTVLLAAASYRWLETPFLRLKERFAFVSSRPV